MRVLTVSAVILGAVLLTGAGTIDGPRQSETRTICLTPNGDTAVQACRVMPGRLNRGDDDNCGCPSGSYEVEASVCARGVTPPAPSAALRQTRIEAARDGSLVGDAFEGREMCTERARRR